ncbi:MAG: 2Fe-2S iron-sulfur cluster binding domain-containing protein [Candidatus Thiodiazotropha sp. (ex Lucinoma borealis)]|nr:2Fe-2S iron-sulfur cluster binding domain-containing protein [Candidatus Thiodiazotropha sp. (ex Lucinoma borealis)]MCU7841699.1 2Fe-2S iron-sulfur cluster binding domain-containing protein [Candidatus Thiodiazotropha sp. (ex Troendleina suluensis)]MCU7855423.1 2Fe-2S iron-sulfur cluster binding domain-containing protein [Candidatus Thiodiazotropha sp. (ex Lucinoma borealis)]
MTTSTLAIIIFAAILIQTTILVLIGLHRRKKLQKSQQNLVTKLVQHSSSQEDVLSNDQSFNSVFPWSGYREFRVLRRKMEDKNNSICSFYLIPTDGKPLPSFEPGQFLTFKLQIDNPSSGQSKTVTRCYSLSDRPRPDYYRVSIKRVPAPVGQPDLPAGIASNFFHEQVHESSKLLAKAPSGHFHLMNDENLPIVLVAGGIGITPMLSILNTLIESGLRREVWFYFGVRNGDEDMMKNHLRMLAETHTNFHLNVCYSAPNEDDEEEIDYHHSERISIPLLRSTLSLKRYQFYVCGPQAMMESLVPGLEAWGVDANDIYYESFGPATLIKQDRSEQKRLESEPMTITFSSSDRSLPWDATADSLLEFAETNDIDVPSGCRAGSCGSCQTSLIKGEVEYNQQPDASTEPGHCLLCIARPKGDLVLEA